MTESRKRWLQISSDVLFGLAVAINAYGVLEAATRGAWLRAGGSAALGAVILAAWIGLAHFRKLLDAQIAMYRAQVAAIESAIKNDNVTVTTRH